MASDDLYSLESFINLELSSEVGTKGRNKGMKRIPACSAEDYPRRVCEKNGSAVSQGGLASASAGIAAASAASSHGEIGSLSVRQVRDSHYCMGNGTSGGVDGAMNSGDSRDADDAFSPLALYQGLSDQVLSEGAQPCHVSWREGEKFDGVDERERTIAVEKTIEKMLCLEVGPGRAVETPHSAAAASDADVEDPFRLVHRGRCTSIRRIRDIGEGVGWNRSQPGSVAMKTLDQAHASESQIALFNNEYDVSVLLADCAAVRNVIRKGTHDGVPALYMEWVEGVSLAQWISSMEQVSTTDFNSLLNLSIAIVQALALLHDSGVIHNKLTSDNIIIEEKDDGAFNVTFIDLSSAYMTRSRFLFADAQTSYASTARGLQHDMYCLGKILYEIFTRKRNQFLDVDLSARSSANLDGRPAGNGLEGYASAKRSKVLGGRAFVPPIELGVPAYLSAMISNLVNGGDETECYTCAPEVERDLRFVFDDQEHLLVHPELGAPGGHLNFPSDRLYGREVEMSMLSQSSHRVITDEAGCGMTLVSGYEGTGKTSVIRQAQRPLLEWGCFFLEGRFEKLQQSRPLSAIVAALDEFCGRILDVDARYVERVAAAIQNSIGSDSTVLSNLIPNLGRVMGVQPSAGASDGIGGFEAQNRLHFFFRKLMLAISNISPVIFFLDDMQWADLESLDLIRLVITDPAAKSVLFLGCYRDNEAESGNPLLTKLRDIEKTGLNTTRIRLGGLDKDSVNSLISATLSLPPQLTKTLSTAVHYKTKGIALFAVQFLHSLCDEHLAWYSLASRRWVWDAEGIFSKDIADNVAQLLATKILKLPRRVQFSLKIAACLGSQFDKSILEIIQKDGEPDIVECLDLAAGEGLVNRSGHKYKFVHERVQQAAYALLSAEKRKMLHLRIGMRLLVGTPEDSPDSTVFLIADQVNRGSAGLLSDPEQRIELVKVNLRAGIKALHSSVFPSAGEYLNAAISLLPEGHWESHYDLSLELFVAAGEAAQALSDFPRLTGILQQMLGNARRFEDKLDAYHLLVVSLGATGKLPEAVGKAFNILAQLGEEFPATASSTGFKEEFVKTNQMLEGMSDTTLLNLNEMVDERKMAAMQFLSNLLAPMYSVENRRELLPWVVFRMVQLTLTYGVCKASVHGFAAYGTILVNIVKDIEGGYRFGKLAISLLKRMKGTMLGARVYSTVYGFIFIWKEPLQACLDPHLEAYELGMEEGDIEYAIVNLQNFSMTAYLSGRTLPVLEKEIRTYSKRMAQHNHHSWQLLLMPIHQAVLSLMGSSENPYLLSGEDVREDELLANAIENDNKALAGNIHFHRMVLAFWLGDIGLAVKMYERCQDIDEIHAGRFQVVIHTFISGLMGFILSHEANDLNWKCVGERAITRMEKWTEHAHWNCQNKLQLLRAEGFFVDGDFYRAAQAYDAAIEGASQHHFVHEEALACERAGVFWTKTGDSSRGSYYFGRAYQLYADWGAEAKLKSLAEYAPSTSGKYCAHPEQLSREKRRRESFCETPEWR